MLIIGREVVTASTHWTMKEIITQDSVVAINKKGHKIIIIVFAIIIRIGIYTRTLSPLQIAYLLGFNSWPRPRRHSIYSMQARRIINFQFFTFVRLLMVDAPDYI